MTPLRGRSKVPKRFCTTRARRGSVLLGRRPACAYDAPVKTRLDGYRRALYVAYKTLAISVPTVVEAALGRLDMARSDRRLDDWSRGILARVGASVNVIHGEHRDAAPAFVLMSNHASYFDVPIVYVAFGRRLRMVAKSELFRVPIWGRAMRDAGFVSVVRGGDPARAAASMDAAGKLIHAGTSVWIAPEGGRSRTGEIGAFKKGGFHLASATRTPILPLYIDGSAKILPPEGGLAVVPGINVQVTFGPPVAVERLVNGVQEPRPIDDVVADVRGFLLAQAAARRT